MIPPHRNVLTLQKRYHVGKENSEKFLTFMPKNELIMVNGRKMNVIQLFKTLM
jgi:hypothetical protein